MATTLSPIISVDEEKCTNCHACITACPVKYCNKANDNHVSINSNLCIGCGQCLDACTHNARIGIDDLSLFLEKLNYKENIVAIVAPAVASNFPGEYLNLNGWLKSIGVKAIFDVSFGAELTIKTYLKHVEENSPKSVIAQPCPALVSYIEIYKPELIPYLAPADSPMMHTMKMVKEFYPQYRNSKFMIISPCVAKKREFDEVGIGDYNVTIKNLSEYLDKNNILLSSFTETDYDNPPAERAVLFSTPGGLLRTARRWNEDIESVSRKIEGPQIIYEYLNTLPKTIQNGYAPLLIDCLNCDLGCNGGTGTALRGKSPDEVERLIDKRNKEMQELYKKKGFFAEKRTQQELNLLIGKYWKDGLYSRSYTNNSLNNNIKIPSNSELKSIYHTMGKIEEKDIYNCSACGYGKCEKMATAIFNNLNKAENCHHYLQNKTNSLLEEVHSRSLKKDEIIELKGATEELTDEITNINSSIIQMSASISEIYTSMNKSKNASDIAVNNSSNSYKIVSSLNSLSSQIENILNLISNTADKLNMLALNATIEAASAGTSGKGFAVVASEVKSLANSTKTAAQEIQITMEDMRDGLVKAVKIMEEVKDSIRSVQEHQLPVVTAVEQQNEVTQAVEKSMNKAHNSVKAIMDKVAQITAS